MSRIKTLAIPAILLAGLALPAAGRAADRGQFNLSDRFRLESDESFTGDLYVFAGDTRISGRIDGDLVAWTGNARLDGEIGGDIIAGAGQLHLSGRAGDTVRAFAQHVTIDGTVDGDLLVFASMLTLTEKARISGNVIGCCAMATVAGTVDGELQLMAGELEIDGTVGRDAHVEADAVRLGSEARILGDLVYKSRRELEMEEGATVAGETIFKQRKGDEEDDGGPGFFSVAWWLWKLLSAMLVGIVVVALSRRFVPAVAGTIGGEPMIGTLIGFGTFLVVPAASIVAIVLLVSLPLGVLGLVLFLVALYLAKIPVAAWLGNRLFTLLGSGSPSPYLAILLGLPILYLLFVIPYLGKLIWLVVIWLGLGATILAVRARLQRVDRPAEG